MTLAQWFVLCACFGALAGGCGGEGPANDGVDDGAGAPFADAGGGVTRSPNASSNKDIAYTVTLTMGQFTVPPNTELYKCQDFANPFGDQSTDIVAFEVVMNAGSHHFTLFNQANATNGPLIDCPEGGLKSGPYSFGAQVEKSRQTYPQGVGVTIPRTMGFTMNSHYINVGATPMQASVMVTMSVAAPGVVTQHAGILQDVLLSIAVPPGKDPVTVTGSCTVPQDMNVIATASHMHVRAEHFISTSGGKTLFETSDVEPPLAQMSPPLPLKSGADITWSCVYRNETDSTLTYGPSATRNVMCNQVFLFYPVADVTNPLLTCIK
jgi:hypothetical protein